MGDDRAIFAGEPILLLLGETIFRRFETFSNGYRGQKGRAFNGPMTLGTKKIEQTSIAIKIISVVFPMKYPSLYTAVLSFSLCTIIRSKEKKLLAREDGDSRTAIEFVSVNYFCQSASS